MTVKLVYIRIHYKLNRWLTPLFRIRFRGVFRGPQGFPPPDSRKEIKAFDKFEVLQGLMDIFKDIYDVLGI